MGQQQLLLIVLGVIIVGIAVVVGINVFTTSSQSSSRDLVVSSLINLGAQAQQYYRKPTALGGGGNDFQGFALTASQFNTAAGEFTISTSVPSGATAITGAAGTVSSSADEIYIVGSGNDIGNDGTNPVKSYVRVTPDSIIAASTPLN